MCTLNHAPPELRDILTNRYGIGQGMSAAQWRLVMNLTWFMRRHEMYTDYKAQRPPMPDAMKLAIPKIQQLLQVCNLGLSTAISDFQHYIVC